MQVMILAGGFGTRISEESAVRPKPMVEIGGRPILWHIMKMYMAHGLSDFVICCGYKGHMIKQYFRDYAIGLADVTFDMRDNTTTLHRTSTEPWRVTLVDTGLETMTGGRIRRAAQYLGDGPFCCTYGDGVSDVDIGAAIEFHRKHGLKATVTAVQPPGRFGMLAIESTRVVSFLEKPQGDGGWINGGFFVLSPRAIDYVEDDGMKWEDAPLRGLAADDELEAWAHRGFWQPMDTMRDKLVLETLVSEGRAPWMTWA